jgi:hypothetical protein
MWADSNKWLALKVNAALIGAPTDSGSAFELEANWCLLKASVLLVNHEK